MPIVCPICHHETKVFKCENCLRSFQLEPEHTESQRQIAEQFTATQTGRHFRGIPEWTINGATIICDESDAKELTKSILTAITKSQPGIIPLFGGGLTLVNQEDLDLCNGVRWYETSHGRARGGNADEYLHRVIAKRMGLDGEVDHVNGLPLDNRRENIRQCTRAQNIANRPKAREGTSLFKGVSRKKGRNNKDSDRWVAQIQLYGKSKHLGYFSTEEAAARAYDEAARAHYGEFAKPNLV